MKLNMKLTEADIKHLDYLRKKYSLTYNTEVIRLVIASKYNEELRKDD